MKHGDATRQRLLDEGLSMLAAEGLHSVTLRGLGLRTGRAHTNVVYYFGDLAGLRDAVAQHAIARQHMRAIARLILDDHPRVAELTAAERAAALASV